MKRPLLPNQQRMLLQLGEQLKLARLRRDISAEQMAERTGLSRSTISKMESGDEGVAIGSYFRLLIALNLKDDLLLLGKDDILGRKLQDIGLQTKARATKQAKDASISHPQ